MQENTVIQNEAKRNNQGNQQWTIAEQCTQPNLIWNEYVSACLLTSLFHHSIIFFSISRKFITGFACVTVGLQSVFFSKFEDVEGFEGKEHIFTHIQKDARDFIDQNIYGIDPQTIREANAKRLKAASNSSNKDSWTWLLWNESASAFLFHESVNPWRLLSFQMKWTGNQAMFWYCTWVTLVFGISSTRLSSTRFIHAFYWGEFINSYSDN